MDIAIIGAGNVGSTLASAAAKAGHRVTIACTDPSHSKAAAEKAGGNARAVATNADAVAAGSIVILAVPYSALDRIVSALGSALDGKVVVDVTNRMGGAPGSTIDGTSAAEQIQQKAPGSKVVKAFNSVLASRQAQPAVDGVQVDGFVAGDDEGAKAQVLQLVRDIGMRPIDAGPLAMARSLEALALLNISLNARNKWPWQSAWKLVGPTG